MEVQQTRNFQFQWFFNNRLNMKGSCELVHDGPCTFEIIKKFQTVCKIGLKYYIVFHFIPFILKIKECKNYEQIFKCFTKVIKQYTKSVLFMGFLVTLLKAVLCFHSSKIPLPLDGKFITISGFASGFSILLQQKSRRNEICYFILAKALGSAYRILERSKIIALPNESKWLHIVLMALLYYVHCDYPEILKYRKMFSFFWGSD